MHVCEKGHEIIGVNETRSGNYVQCRYCKNTARRRHHVPFVVWLRQELDKANLRDTVIEWSNGRWVVTIPPQRNDSWVMDGPIRHYATKVQAYRDAFIDAVKSNDRRRADELLNNPPPGVSAGDVLLGHLDVVMAVFTAWYES